MNDLSIISILGFVSVIVTIIAGVLAVKKNVRDYNNSVILGHVALEHRLTALETSVGWIKDHLPRRKSDTDA
jgi:hypothetical protein